MKKLFVLFFLPMMAFAVVDDWQTVAISSRASVDFPKEPTQTESSGNPVWMSSGDNSRCAAVAIDFKKMGLDSAQLNKEIETQQGFENFRNSFLAQIAGATLVSERKTKVLGYNTFDFLVNLADKQEPSYNKMYSRIIFVGATGYVLYFYEKDAKPEPDTRKRFFSSFKLN